MEFCKICNSLLFYFKEKGVVNAYCKKCSISKESLGVSFTEKSRKEFTGSGITSEENVSATYDNKCRKCGHVGAEVIEVGVLFSDEDHLTLLKCGKCGFSERLGRKVT